MLLWRRRTTQWSEVFLEADQTKPTKPMDSVYRIAQECSEGISFDCFGKWLIRALWIADNVEVGTSIAQCLPPKKLV